MNRYEIKFDISEYKQHEIIKDYKLVKLYPQRIIDSIYFDTINYDYFYDSEEGQVPRKKIRIRNYNKGKIYSLEFKFTNFHHREKIVFNNFTYNYQNLLRRIKELHIHDLIYPNLLVNYTRQYYSSSIGRITIDKNISYQKVDNYFKPTSAALHDHKTILEVKIQKDFFDKNKVLKFFNFKESRNSKYCNGINVFRVKFTPTQDA